MRGRGAGNELERRERIPAPGVFGVHAKKKTKKNLTQRAKVKTKPTADGHRFTQIRTAEKMNRRSVLPL